MRLIFLISILIAGMAYHSHAQSTPDPVKALEAYEAAEKAYKKGDMETAFAQITIAEQNGPNLSRIKALKEKIVLAQQASKEAEMRKALEKKRADSIATAQKLFKEAEQKRIADSIQKAKEEAKAEAIRLALEKRSATALTELKNNA